MASSLLNRATSSKGLQITANALDLTAQRHQTRRASHQADRDPIIYVRLGWAETKSLPQDLPPLFKGAGLDAFASYTKIVGGGGGGKGLHDAFNIISEELTNFGNVI